MIRSSATSGLGLALGALLLLVSVVPASAADSTPALTLNPASAPPGSTVQAVGTFTATADATFEVNMDLQGTAGQGTFQDPGSVSGLDSCGLDSTQRSFTCTWTGAATGDTRVITLTLNVGAGAVPGQAWPVAACSNPNTQEPACDFKDLVISAATTSPSPTSTPTPTGSVQASAEATSEAAAALPTAVPAGQEPGSATALPFGLFGAGLAALAGIAASAVLLARRRGRYQA